MLNNEIEYYLYKSVNENNILPITSKCNLGCIFCSHKQNPSDFEIISLGNLRINKIYELIDFLNSDNPVIIGESATKIIEGEPLLHPEFKKIIYKLRYIYKDTKIKITTNGVLLDKNMVDFLSDLGNITLNISINTLNDNLRKKIMSIKSVSNIGDTLILLNNKKLDYNFSMVALPHVYGYKQIEDDLNNMIKYNPTSIRIFMPGFTKYSNKKMNFNYKKVYNNLYKIIKNINIINNIPITIEPPNLIDLKKEVIGLIKDSPADLAGINYLDEILEVNDKKPVSRVDTYNIINNLKDPKIKIKRNDKILELKLKKNKGNKSGIIMDYDISREKLFQIDKLIRKNTDNNILFLTSHLGFDLIKFIINKYLNFKSRDNIKIEMVDNTYLDGSIICAGLLTNFDIKRHLSNKKDNKYNLIVLPNIMYDVFGNDMCGNNYKNIEKEYNLEIELI